jgi:hypothetical protein
MLKFQSKLYFENMKKKGKNNSEGYEGLSI